MIVDQIREVMPPFFLVKIPKKEQRERLEKIGSLYYPPEHVFMKRGMQCGEIVLIGKRAHEFFPEAKVGDILICHHFIEGKTHGNKQKFFAIDEDENWNYYCVTAFCHNGDRNNTFGVWNGERIIPSKDYVFFEIDEALTSDLPELTFEVQGMPKIITNLPFQETESGLITTKTRKKTRLELIEKLHYNTREIRKWSRWIPITPEKVIPLITRLEKENENISKEVNTVVYEPHILHAFNEQLKDTVHPDLKKGDRVYALSISCYMQVEFMGVEYIVSESKYVSLKCPD
jgi:hypothetical protein